MNKKKVVIRGICLIGILIFVFIDKMYPIPSQSTQKETDVRNDFDILRADELKMDRVTDDYLFSVEQFLQKNTSDSKDVKKVLQWLAKDLNLKRGEKLYVSKRPIYFWDAGLSKVDDRHLLLLAFNESLSKIVCCELYLNYYLFGKKCKVASMEGSLYEDANFLLDHKKEKYIYVSVIENHPPYTTREDLLMDSESDIVTPAYNGVSSFDVTTRGDYFGRIQAVKDLTFSYENLIKKDNLMELEW